MCSIGFFSENIIFNIIQYNFMRFSLQGLGWTNQQLPSYKFSGIAAALLGRELLCKWIKSTYLTGLLCFENHPNPPLYGRKFSLDFPTKEDWSTECVDLVALDGLVFFTDGSLCEGRAGAIVFSEILNVRESYTFGS
jgi:hypothetical protein